jgi:hypothetical protein
MTLDEWFVEGKLKRLDVTERGIVLELEGYFLEALRAKEQDARIGWLDVVEGFVGEIVNIRLRCYQPHLCEKIKVALAQPSAGINGESPPNERLAPKGETEALKTPRARSLPRATSRKRINQLDDLKRR